jgi:hypothetical protein
MFAQPITSTRKRYRLIFHHIKSWRLYFFNFSERNINRHTSAKGKNHFKGSPRAQESMIYKNHYFSRKLGNNLATKSQTTSS